MKFLKELFDRRPKVTAMIEMPQGSLKKIEIKDGKPIVNCELPIPVPISYGYIPGTLCEDGDPLDIFVISNRYLNTGDLVNVRAIGIFECLDQGLCDNKVLAVVEDEEYLKFNYLKYMAQVANYLMNYKSRFEVKGWRDMKTQKDLDKYYV